MFLLVGLLLWCHFLVIPIPFVLHLINKAAARPQYNSGLAAVVTISNNVGIFMTWLPDRLLSHYLVVYFTQNTQLIVLDTVSLLVAVNLTLRNSLVSLTVTGATLPLYTSNVVSVSHWSSTGFWNIDV